MTYSSPAAEVDATPSRRVLDPFHSALHFDLAPLRQEEQAAAPVDLENVKLGKRSAPEEPCREANLLGLVDHESYLLLYASQGWTSRAVLKQHAIAGLAALFAFCLDNSDAVLDDWQLALVEFKIQ